jgi:hypothetical protein
MGPGFRRDDRWFVSSYNLTQTAPKKRHRLVAFFLAVPKSMRG